MNYTSVEKNNYIEQNKEEFGDLYYQMKWINPYAAFDIIKERDEYFEKIVQLGGKSEYNRTKIDTNNMSPGCKLCAEGVWSCLFINTMCNASCYYCPASQKNVGIPGTNTVDFANANDYADYISRFNFKGMSISGGEPFVTFDKTVEYIKAVKKRMGDDIYIWVYTNGKLATAENLLILKSAGVQEIRFDIGATEYTLENAKKAVGIIDRVTVEIPSTPDNFEILKEKIVEMKEAGISGLNFHQLRATKHNVQNFIDRGFTFIHGPKVTVLESELNALKLIEYSLSASINLPINYCSSIYKALFQLSGSRRRHANSVLKEFEAVTKAGYIRKYFVQVSSESTTAFVDKSLFYLDIKERRYYIKESLLPLCFEQKIDCYVQYYTPHIARDVKNKGEMTEEIFKSPVGNPILLLKEIDSNDLDINDELDESLVEILRYESLPFGFTEYF